MKKLSYIISTFIFTFLIPNLLYPILPVIGGLGLAAPLVGSGVANAKVSAVRKVVVATQQMLGSVKLGLLIAVLLLIATAGLIVIRVVKKMKMKRNAKTVITLLSCLHTDLTLSKNKAKNKSINLLLKKLDNKLLMTKRNKNVLKRITKALKSLRKNDMRVEDQAVVVGQCLRNFVLISF